MPEEITRDLDFSTLTPCKDTFVGRKLARSYSDVLYEIRFRNKPAYLYFLFEHKSWEPDFPGVQLLKNMAFKYIFHPEILSRLLVKSHWTVGKFPETLGKFVFSSLLKLTLPEGLF